MSRAENECDTSWHLRCESKQRVAGGVHGAARAGSSRELSRIAAGYVWKYGCRVGIENDGKDGHRKGGRERKVGRRAHENPSQMDPG